MTPLAVTTLSHDLLIFVCVTSVVPVCLEQKIKVPGMCRWSCEVDSPLFLGECCGGWFWLLGFSCRCGSGYSSDLEPTIYCSNWASNASNSTWQGNLVLSCFIQLCFISCWQPQVQNPNDAKDKTRLGTFTRRLGSQHQIAVKIAVFNC